MLRDHFHRGAATTMPARVIARPRERRAIAQIRERSARIETLQLDASSPRRVAILSSASLGRDEVRLRRPRGAGHLKNAIDFVGAAHPGVAGYVDLNAIANSDNEGRGDHHRIKRRFFRSIDAANSRAIKKQDPTGRPFTRL
jgi:hypothetical protein